MIPENYDDMIANLKKIRKKCELGIQMCCVEDIDPHKVDRIYSAMCGVHDLWIKFDNEIQNRMWQQTQERYGEL